MGARNAGQASKGSMHPSAGPVANNSMNKDDSYSDNISLITKHKFHGYIVLQADDASPTEPTLKPSKQKHTLSSSPPSNMNKSWRIKSSMNLHVPSSCKRHKLTTVVSSSVA